jgi:hypothetical protein
MKIKQILGTFDKTKDGVPFTIKNGARAGEAYQKQSVVFAEHGETIFSLPCFKGKLYKEGDDVKGEAGEIREYNGKKYGNWNFPKSKAKLEAEAKDKEIADLKAQLANKK